MADDFQAALAEFVSFPSVINVESCRESCRQAALWLKRLLSQVSGIFNSWCTLNGPDFGSLEQSLRCCQLAMESTRWCSQLFVEVRSTRTGPESSFMGEWDIDFLSIEST